MDVATVNRVQADNDGKHAVAVATLMASMEKVTSAALQVGSILMVKWTNEAAETRLVCQTLTNRQMQVLATNPYMLKDPATVLDRLHEPTEHLLPPPVSDDDDDGFLGPVAYLEPAPPR
jgi:hypothetical protein